MSAFKEQSNGPELGTCPRAIGTSTSRENKGDKEQRVGDDSREGEGGGIIARRRNPEISRGSLDLATGQKRRAHMLDTLTDTCYTIDCVFINGRATT